MRERGLERGREREREREGERGRERKREKRERERERERKIVKEKDNFEFISVSDASGTVVENEINFSRCDSSPFHYLV